MFKMRILKTFTYKGVNRSLFERIVLSNAKQFSLKSPNFYKYQQKFYSQSNTNEKEKENKQDNNNQDEQAQGKI
jgi:DNA replication protein DnaD